MIHQKILEENGHSYADLELVAGSPGSAGRELGEVFNEKEEDLSEAYSFWEPRECPEEYAGMELVEPDPGVIAERVDCVICAVPSSAAREIEPELRERGVNVFSNASEFRWEENVPLFIPEVNPGHVERMEAQDTPGVQANNPNCTTAGFTPVLDAVDGVREVRLTTLQAISGKGDRIAEESYRERIVGNARDDWGPETPNGEEVKSETEPQKILGNVKSREEAVDQYRGLRKGREPDSITPVFSQTNRIATQYGHLECVTLEFEEQTSAEQVRESLENYSVPEQVRELPSTPDELFVVLDETVEPREHVFEGEGMAIAVSDIRQLTPRKVSMKTLSHNLRRGATWTARQSMELYLNERDEIWTTAG